jgi:hypothetical protein
MEAQYEKSQAHCWLTTYGEDFKTVCDLANFSPDYIRSRAAQALARNCKWRNTNSYPSKRPPTEQSNMREMELV